MMDGILNVYKEAGWTSNDVVVKLRGVLGTRKVGHGGTLDPAVTGVLPVAVGRATRLLEYMDGAGKAYEGELVLGASTETEDAEGPVVRRTPVAEGSVEAATVDGALSRFVGVISQTPPLYSAVKVNGKKLYEYARAGQLDVARPTRQVTITELVRTSPVSYGDGCARFDFRVACGKGTYVRTLCVDVAAALGYAGHMSRLRRTMANGLEISDALTIAEIADHAAVGTLSAVLQPLSAAVSALPRREITALELTEVSHGRRLVCRDRDGAADGPVAVFYRAQLVGIYVADEGELKAKKVLL